MTPRRHDARLPEPRDLGPIDEERRPALQFFPDTDYEFGGQSFGPSLLSRFDLGSRWSLNTRVDSTVMILGAINSEYAKIAQVGDRERLRE